MIQNSIKEVFYINVYQIVYLLDGGDETQMQVVEENEDVGDDSEKETTRAVAGMQAVSQMLITIKKELRNDGVNCIVMLLDRWCHTELRNGDCNSVKVQCGTMDINQNCLRCIEIAHRRHH